MYEGQVVIDNRTKAATIVIGGKSKTNTKNAEWLLHDEEVQIPPISGEATITYTLDTGFSLETARLVNANEDRIEAPIRIINGNESTHGTLTIMTAEGKHYPDAVIAQLSLEKGGTTNVTVKVSKEGVADALLGVAVGAITSYTKQIWEIGKISLVFTDGGTLGQSGQSLSEAVFDAATSIAAKLM